MPVQPGTALSGGKASVTVSVGLVAPPASEGIVRCGLPFSSVRMISSLDHVVSRTPLGRLATMDEVAEATEFLLFNGAVNGVNLPVDGGWLLT